MASSKLLDSGLTNSTQLFWGMVFVLVMIIPYLPINVTQKLLTYWGMLMISLSLVHLSLLLSSLLTNCTLVFLSSSRVNLTIFWERKSTIVQTWLLSWIKVNILEIFCIKLIWLTLNLYHLLWSHSANYLKPNQIYLLIPLCTSQLLEPCSMLLLQDLILANPSTKSVNSNQTLWMIIGQC